MAPELPENEFPPFEASSLSIVRMCLIHPATDIRPPGEHTGCLGPSVRDLASSSLIGPLGVALVHVFLFSAGCHGVTLYLRRADTRPDSETPRTLPDPLSASSALARMLCCPFQPLRPLNSILCLNSASPAAFLGFPSLHSRLTCMWAHRVSCSASCSPMSAELFRVLFLLFSLFAPERQA